MWNSNSERTVRMLQRTLLNRKGRGRRNDVICVVNVHILLYTTKCRPKTENEKPVEDLRFFVFEHVYEMSTKPVCRLWHCCVNSL